MVIEWKISQNSNCCAKKVISIVGFEDIDGKVVRISEHQMPKFKIEELKDSGIA